MSVSGWLAWLGGAQRDILRQAPGDLVKHSAMGGVLISTAAVAGASAAFALSTAVDLPALPSIVVGLVWGLVILNLDRMLIVSLDRKTGLVKNLIGAAARVLLAVVIGAVISVPLVLRIFEPEIERELEVIKNEDLLTAQDQLRDRFALIPQLEQREAELQGIVAGRSRESVADDPEVARLQAAFNTKSAEFDEAEANVVCEIDGTCGSNQVGRGPAFREKVDRQQRLQRERDDLRAQLDAATAAALERIASGQTQASASAQDELARVQDELARLRADKRAAEDAFAVTGENNDGLLARLEALDRLSENRSAMALANLALFLLFLFIEVLPVLVKLLAIFGSPTLYDQLLERREKDALDNDDVWSAKQREITDIRVDVRTRLERDRADAQVNAGRKANALLVDKQSEIAEKAIEAWAQVAIARSDDEVARWYRRYAGGTTAPAAVAAMGGGGARPTPPPAGPVGPPAGYGAGLGAAQPGSAYVHGPATAPAPAQYAPPPGPASSPNSYTNFRATQFAAVVPQSRSAQSVTVPVVTGGSGAPGNGQSSGGPQPPHPHAGP